MIDHSATVLDAAPGCADRDRLRAEFDAIIAANFPAGAGRPAPPRRTVRVGVGRAPDLDRRAAIGGSPQDGPDARRGRATHLRARQRGPPPPRHCRSEPNGGDRSTGHW